MNLLIIFAREPKLGKVKTRLAKSIGQEKALAAYQLLLKKTLSTFKQTNYKVKIYYTARQSGRNLGSRMLNAFKDNIRKYDKIALIGVDCPFITKTIVRQSFTALSQNPLVIGPSKDGGYYLIGLTKIFPEIFKGVDWGTGKVLRQTVKRSRIKPHLLKKLYDIDTVKDYKRWKIK
jgi:uncharacterized protein